jgi:hypothetical protein
MILCTYSRWTITLVAALFAFVALAAGQQCSFESNMDYFGSDLSAYPIFTATSDLCCSACNVHPVCQAWTYVPNSQACWLKYAIGVRRFNSDGSKRTENPFLT